MGGQCLPLGGRKFTSDSEPVEGVVCLLQGDAHLEYSYLEGEQDTGSSSWHVDML